MPNIFDLNALTCGQIREAMAGLPDDAPVIASDGDGKNTRALWANACTHREAKPDDAGNRAFVPETELAEYGEELKRLDKPVLVVNLGVSFSNCVRDLP